MHPADKFEAEYYEKRGRFPSIPEVWEEAQRVGSAQTVPVGKVVTVGGYPDDSQHTVDWLVKHKDLREGQLLYTRPAPLDDDTRKMVLALIRQLDTFAVETYLSGYGKELAAELKARLEAGE